MKSQSKPELRYNSWKRKFDFLFTTAGYSIGLGNVWRFSYVCYKQGGGAFIFAYLVLASLFIFPAFLIEAALGQWRRQGMIKSWDVIPIFKDNLMYLVIVWLLTYFAIFKGVNWAAKVAYVTATLPAVLIVILLIRATLLDGALMGIKEFITPDFSRLASLELWTSAATQVLYSTAVCAGVYLSMRSHNNYHDNFARDGLIIIFGNFFASFFCGLATFSTLGFMANYMNTTVAEVVDSGFGLVFITYPQTLSLLPFPRVWCALFFILLFLLGFDTQFAGCEALVASVIDLIPRRYKPKRFEREIVSLILCLLMFAISVIFVTQGGIYALILFNHYLFFWNTLLLVFCYYLAFGWIYGAERYWKKVEEMLGPTRFKIPILIAWKFIGPVLSLGLAAQAIIEYQPLSYGSYVFPTWANVIGHLISALNFAIILIYAVYLCLTSKEKLIELIRPSISAEETALEYMKKEKEAMI